MNLLLQSDPESENLCNFIAKHQVKNLNKLENSSVEKFKAERKRKK